MKPVIVIAAAMTLGLTACGAGLSPAERKAQDQWDAMSSSDQAMACLIAGSGAGEALDFVEGLAPLESVTGEPLMSEEDVAVLTIMERNC